MLLWADLESSGLDVKHDEIIEAAFILTDTDLNEVWRAEYVIPPTMAGMTRLRDNAVVLNMHRANGLLAEVAYLRSISMDRKVPAQVDIDVVAKMRAAGVAVGDTVHLAGSGVATFDREMIKHWMPETSALLHYATIDVGVIKRCWTMWTGGDDITGDQVAKRHRAMSDIEGHLNEARAFRAAFRLMALTSQS